IREGDRFLGNRTRAKVVKNKVAAPYRTAEFDIMFDSGISAEGDLLDLAIAEQIVDKSGAWFSYKNTRLGQGRENAKQFIRDDPELFEELKAAIIAKRFSKPTAKEASTDSEAPATTKMSAKVSAAKRKRA
ncbi:MAG: DNA recombination/repair protein RecA, partial [Gammaproteobacteria bacterium]|nr:DNA recombination/repair protein RecA [Gammaproteobacteria bacterium]